MKADHLHKLISSAIENPGTIKSVEELKGDASTRRYFRIILEGDSEITGGHLSMIMMRYPPSHVVDGELAFLNVHRYLHRAGISVPRVYLHIPEANMLFLEDGGDRTLEDIVEDAGFTEETEKIYDRAIDQIVTIQAKGTNTLDDRALPSKHSFDFDKLMWEMDFLAKWGLLKLKGTPDEVSVKADFLSLVEPVVNYLTTLPLVLVHRDFHSRNIMVLDHGEIRILDFQDARMGNIYYDLSSLLFDSYVTLPTPTQDRLMNRYIENVKNEPFATFGSKDEYCDNLHTMAIQRNLKALGTFYYMFYGKGNDRYLKYIIRTVNHLRENPIFSERYRDLSVFVLPLLEELLDQVTLEGGISIEGNDPRRGSGDKTPPSNI